MPLISSSITGSPPHTRGAGAVAGDNVPTRQDHPRIRGEQVDDDDENWRVAGSPPHTRGAVGMRRCPRAPLRITPAYAGSSRGAGLVHDPAWDHPRIRGEQSFILASFSSLNGSPPHTRGAGAWQMMEVEDAGITPAYAGSRPQRSPPSFRTPDHPRIRGEQKG